MNYLVISSVLTHSVSQPVSLGMGVCVNKLTVLNITFQGKREYLDTLHKYLEIHGTFFGVTVSTLEQGRLLLGRLDTISIIFYLMLGNLRTDHATAIL